MKKNDFAKKVSGFDSKKRWGNSAIKGMGVNSPAMMEARKKGKGSLLRPRSSRNEGEKMTTGYKGDEEARA